ncbi:helix-turn-helix transcriptional regulator [Kitasatospora sp. NPDC088783]|uniref:helix-turn-helix transcriptional regulator n=1 Tax=Kitasatospora sp. NPDC088783 TaxID=3364077 RepID=UPI00380D8C9D
MDEKFGAWLGRQLHRAGLTQAEFAEQVGVTRAAVSAWIVGRAVPSPVTLPKVAAVLEAAAATEAKNPQT